MRFDKLKFRFGALKHHFLQRDLSLFNLSRSCYRGDLSRSVPFIMCGHPNMDFFQALVVSIFNTNPRSICLLMIFEDSGQAPSISPHLIHGMSHFEMSGHDTKVDSFDLILPPN